MGNLGYLAFFARDYRAASDYCRQAIDLDPTHIAGRWVGGIVLTGQECYREAIAELEEVRRGWPSVRVLGWLGYACGRAGATARARDLLAALDAMPPDRTARCFEMARIHIGLGELEAALGKLEDACEARETEIAGHLAVDPSMDPLRTHERFKAILRRVGLPN
jgi:tetratricopeptide (TPR) repeat protein